MSYVTEVVADAPKNWWRCADPGGAYLLDFGSTPDHLIFNTAAEVYTPYVGPVSSGGSCSVGLGYFWDNQGIAMTQPLTVECWVWLHSLSSTTVIPVLLAGPSATMLQIGILTSGLVQVNGPTGQINSGTAISRQHWHQLVATIAAGGAGQLYVDAVLKSSGALGNSAGGNTTIAVGGLTGTSNNRFQGNIAEVAVYSTVLAGGRVTAHFAAADNVASLPVFRAFGGPGVSPDGSILNSDESAAILAAVRKTFPTT